MNYVSSLARLTGFCVLLGMGGLAQAHHPAYELARGDGASSPEGSDQLQWRWTLV
ncbi:hypothetical protein [Alcaligenes pakistanensis]|uniref:hypothetical protein n=1 Tax=Alcaligenes pakistanensis TaxID=1482717 RepID=UPI00167A5383|nr:hypothetical protein [Alcaligenes pakistanensis]